MWISILTQHKWPLVAVLGVFCLLAGTGAMAELMIDCNADDEFPLAPDEDAVRLGDASAASRPLFVRAGHVPRQSLREETVRIPGELHILLLGFDLSEKKFAGRTDAILIVRLKTSARRMGFVSVPRDLWVDIPGAEPARINSVVRIGERLNGRGGGLQLLKEVIRNTFDIAIDHTVSVDFSGFSSIIDSLGGIDVDVHCPIRDNFHIPGQPGKTEHFSLEAGRQHIDGRQALYYTRSRHGRSDLDRAVRQQAVLSGIFRKVSDPLSWHRLPSVVAQVQEFVSTDIPLRRLMSLVARYRSFDASRLHGMVIREPLIQEYRTEEGKAVLLLDRALFQARMQQLFASRTPGAPLRRRCPDVDAALHWKSATPHH